ncbi:hypothetical protein K2173_025983 [Erythroxylum novogranatense]|uniref:RIN4 pathogenic type III effector avirulence factor Avr cleavage site domain-containing protein n=1 Tax=Erythroxylum novogranatense TaxID=1862640 RepID=A0AAV8SHY1_9ROSI|nr:hypothetical protein K2173_025983 [Erythroxylum novogranatense]
MAKRCHVPKFGNWEKDNTPYTAFFESARKEKSGAKTNPNDPEENPQAFGYERRGTEREAEYSFFNQTPIHPSHKKTYADISNNKGDYRAQNAHRIHLSDQPKSVRPRRSRLSEEPGVNRRNSDRPKNPSKPKSIKIEPESKSVSGSNSFSTPSKSQSSNSSFARHRRRTRRNSPRADTDNHLRASSPVPKFGSWDEVDHRSCEVFTELFNRVKEEKTCVIYPANTPQPTYHLNRRKPQRSSRRQKFCCCPFFG